jgi:hypothetical protein
VRLSSQQFAVSTQHTDLQAFLYVCLCSSLLLLLLLLLLPKPAGVAGNTTTDASTTPDISHAANTTHNKTSAVADRMTSNQTAGET